VRGLQPGAEAAVTMRAMNHPDYVYQPWSAERKSAASQCAKDRIRAKNMTTLILFPKRTLTVAQRRRPQHGFNA